MSSGKPPNKKVYGFMVASSTQQVGQNLLRYVSLWNQTSSCHRN